VQAKDASGTRSVLFPMLILDLKNRNYCMRRIEADSIRNFLGWCLQWASGLVLNSKVFLEEMTQAVQTGMVEMFQNTKDY
jgi:hypothetical protein